MRRTRAEISPQSAGDRCFLTDSPAPLEITTGELLHLDQQQPVAQNGVILRASPVRNGEELPLRPKLRPKLRPHLLVLFNKAG